MASIKFPDGSEVNLDCSDAEAKLLQNGVNALAERADSAEDAKDELIDLINSVKFDEEEEEMSIAERMKRIKKDMEGAAGDKKKMAELKGKYDQLKPEMEKGKTKMDSSDVMSLIEVVDSCRRLDSSIEIKNDSGEFKSQTELMREALKSHNKDIKLDGFESDESYLRARLDAAVEYANIAKQRCHQTTKMDSTKLTAQQRADAKFYGEK